jgi:hypothetical protein
VPIRPDIEWQTALRPRDRRVVTALTAPLLLQYGYLLRARPAVEAAESWR